MNQRFASSGTHIGSAASDRCAGMSAASAVVAYRFEGFRPRFEARQQPRLEDGQLFWQSVAFEIGHRPERRSQRMVRLLVRHGRSSAASVAAARSALPVSNGAKAMAASMNSPRV
jgi:hypothetical protein